MFLLRLSPCLPAIASAAAAAAPVSFSRQIAPILADQCLECHREGKSKGSYRLDTFEGLLKPGDSEQPPVVPEDAEKSEMFRLLITPHEEDRMPKKADALPEPAIALIRQWLNEGAKLDAGDPGAPIASLIPAQPRPKAPDKYPRPLPVTALALNGDGKVLAASGYYEVLLWDPGTGKLRGRIGDMPERIHGLAFIGAGSWLAVAGGVPGRSGEAWLVNATNPAERRKLAQMRDTALCAVASRDGKRLFVGGADNRIRGFAMPDGKPLWNVEAHADWVLALAVSADGKQIATGSRDRTARIIDAADGTIDATFTGHSVPVSSVAFTPDGTEAVSGGSDGDMRRWELNGTGVKESTVRAGGRSEVLALGFVDATTAAAACANGQINLIDPKTRGITAKLAQHEDRVNAMVIANAGGGDTLVITGSHDGVVRVSSLSGGAGAREKRLTFIASPGW